MKNVRIALMTLLLILIFATACFAGKIADKLTAEELAKVKTGEVLLKNDISKESKSGSGVAYGIFKCSLDDFWNVIFDYPNYSDIFPRIKSAKIIDKNAEQFLTDFEMDATITTLKYTSYNRPSIDKLRLDFGLEKDRPHKYFKEMKGYWLLEELEPGVYLAEYKIDVALDVPLIGGMLTKITNSMAGKDLPNVFKSVRKRIESGGKWKLSDGL